MLSSQVSVAITELLEIIKRKKGFILIHGIRFQSVPVAFLLCQGMSRKWSERKERKRSESKWTFPIVTQLPL